MAGILNSKERLIDFIITPEGRRQMASGRMKIEFAALTDQHTFYSTEHPDRIADDASKRIFFESHSSTTDVIVPEIDAGDKENNTQPFRAGNFVVDGKTFAEGTYSTSTGSYYRQLSGSSIIDRADQLTESLVNHFEGLRILGTNDTISNYTGFEVSAVSGSFIITDQDVLANQGKGIYLKDISTSENPEGREPDGIVDIRNSPSIYSDPRFSHLPNYRYLPPRNLPGPDQSENDPVLAMGSYPNFSSAGKTLDLDELIDSLSSRQKIVFDFKETSIDNNIVGQMFEFSNQGVEKLSVIDYGASYKMTDNGPQPSHVYFIGKLMKDQEGVQTFMNIFTLVLESKEY